jgi:ATP-binding cassette subfamily F protein uup
MVHNIGEGNDFVVINGQKRHVIGYLQDFLFTPERCRTPVHILSGGEKNRLMLAKLFATPSNVLVLDEPTNDLDAETLELLEELLLDYAGTLLLVSHDRAFLNHVVTSTLVFEGQGQVGEFVGGYDDWLAQRPAPPASRPEASSGRISRPASTPPGKRKLGYREKQELQDLPQRIEALEASRQSAYAALSDPLLYKKGKGQIAALKARLAQVENEIEDAYGRWETLEDLQKR